MGDKEDEDVFLWLCTHRQQEPIRKKTTVMKGCVVRVLVSRMVAHGYFATSGETGISKLTCQLDFLISVAATAARAIARYPSSKEL